MKYKKELSSGFTLAEIIISLLLLSILTLGTYSNTFFINRQMNQHLLEFISLQNTRQTDAIERLRRSYPDIDVDSAFIELDCLVSSSVTC